MREKENLLSRMLLCFHCKGYAVEGCVEIEKSSSNKTKLHRRKKIAIEREIRAESEKSHNNFDVSVFCTFVGANTIKLG